MSDLFESSPVELNSGRLQTLQKGIIFDSPNLNSWKFTTLVYKQKIRDKMWKGLGKVGDWHFWKIQDVWSAIVLVGWICVTKCVYTRGNNLQGPSGVCGFIWP